MMSTIKKVALSLACLALTANAHPLKRQSMPAACSNYTIVVTRGTYEPQGGSLGFDAANKAILRTYPEGNTYNTVYPASPDQNSTSGTIDIVRKVHELVDADVNHCVFLEGYSQGAQATVDAMPNITNRYFDAIKHVVLLGDPLHKPGLACNVDSKGGNKTLYATGEAYKDNNGFVLSTWVNKTTDVCARGDGICDSQHGNGITPQHLSYIFSKSVQQMTAKSIEAYL